MIQFRKKTIKKKIRKRQNNQKINKRLRHHRSLLIKFAVMTGVLLFIVGLIVLGKTTIFSSKHTINHVTFAPESIDTYDDSAIYTRIQKEVVGENYYLLKWNKEKALQQDIQEVFPIIKDIRIEQSGEQRVYISIDFHRPTLLFQNPSGYTAVYEHELFPLVSGNTLGDEVLSIQIPKYTSGYSSLHGILHEIDELKLVSYITTIQDTLGEKHIEEIIYLPGGLKLFVIYKGKRVYFHLDQEVNRQLAKLVDMENRYDGFENISVIDLGSIDDIIVR